MRDRQPLAESRDGSDPVPRWRRLLPLIISVAIFALALHGLANEFSEHGYREIRQAFHGLAWSRVGLALLLALGSYACLIGFDAIGLARSKHALSPIRLVATAFLAHAVGHTLGFAALTGGSVRWRGYSRAGLDLAAVGQVVLVSSLGFVFGAWVVLAAALLLEPDDAARVLPVSASIVRWSGVALALAYALAVALAGKAGREIRIAKLALWLPDRRTLLLVSVLSVFELALAGGALYVLLAPIEGVSFAGFIGLWLVAVLAGLVSSVPGGLGVFEWSMLQLLPAVAPAALLAAALVYRIIYYILPLTLAAMLAAGASAYRPVMKRAGMLRAAWTAVRPWLPRVIALAAFMVGAALVIDGTLPTAQTRIVDTALPLVETSHLLASLGGVVLLLIGQGLQRRGHAAWWVAMVICLLLPVPIWFRGGHGAVWLAALLMAVVLWVSRREFYREGALLDEAWSWPWLRNLLLVLVATFWLLFFAYSHVEYQNELWWQFALSGNAPRALRALLLVALVVIVFGVARLLRGTREALPVADAQQLWAIQPVLDAATDSQANLALTGDKALLRDAEGDGFVMMQRHGGSLIAMGDPIGPPEVARALIWRFREEADRLGLRPVFYQVGEAYWQTYLDLGLSLAKLGEEAIVPLDSFSLEGPARAELRQAWNKGKRSGMTMRIIAAAEVEGLLPTLERISDAWLEEKAGEEKGFSLGSFDPAYLKRLPAALVEREGEVVAFANLWMAPGGKELSIDLMRHAADAPKGAMDFLFIELFLWGKVNGYTRFSLGMAPLSGMAKHRLAGRWNRLATLIARHGERFYGFTGLFKFKAKFSPVWRPRYLAAPGGLHLPAALLDVTRLISMDPVRSRDD